MADALEVIRTYIGIETSEPRNIGQNRRARIYMTLQAALNGSREHPSAPRTLDDIAREARSAIEAGATSLHIHPFDENGKQTLRSQPCQQTLQMIRHSCPSIPISFSTSSTIEPDPDEKRALISSWAECPDLVTANQGEDGIIELCELLLDRGIGIEAGLLSLSDARKFVNSGIAGQCERVMVEPLDAEPETAVAHAADIERLLKKNTIELEQVHHGDGIASWAVTRRAIDRGHGIRTGIEDTTVLPDGTPADGNRELVNAAVEMVKGP